MGCNFAAAIVVYFFLYETKALSLENVDAMYSDWNTTARNSSKWVPEGYFDRDRRDSAYWRRKPSAAERTGSIGNMREERVDVGLRQNGVERKENGNM